MPMRAILEKVAGEGFGGDVKVRWYECTHYIDICCSSGQQVDSEAAFAIWLLNVGGQRSGLLERPLWMVEDRTWIGVELLKMPLVQWGDDEDRLARHGHLQNWVPGPPRRWLHCFLDCFIECEQDSRATLNAPLHRVPKNVTHVHLCHVRVRSFVAQAPC